jgi:hypothetical protein
MIGKSNAAIDATKVALANFVFKLLGNIPSICHVFAPPHVKAERHPASTGFM